MSEFLEVHDVCKRFGDLEVVKNVSFTVSERETFAIIGPNGAGKTTLFKIMTGEAKSNSGEFLIGGKSINRLSAYQRARLGIGRTFQVARVFEEMSAFENVVVSVESRRRSDPDASTLWRSRRPTKEVAEEVFGLLEKLSLVDDVHQEARFLSHGDKKRLELAVVLGLRPRILMLDEPTAGMAASDRIVTANLIKKISQETGITVVLTEHDMDVVFGLADRLLVLNYGEVIAMGGVEEVRSNPLVRQIYLGEEMYGDA